MSTPHPQPHGVQDPVFFHELSSAKADGFNGANIPGDSMAAELDFGNLAIGLNQDGAITYQGSLPTGPIHLANHAELEILIHTLQEVVHGHRATVSSDSDPRFLPGIKGTAAVILKYAREQERGHLTAVSDADKKHLASLGFD